jgi:superfamily II DNA helicase RecQ
MSALVRHFGDMADARSGCGKCDVCDPAGAELRLFRRATAWERQRVQDIVESLRGAAYKTPKGLRDESSSWSEAMSRDEFEELLSAMARAGLIAIENTEFEKDGRVIPYRRISLTDAGEQTGPMTPLPLLISDGVVQEFGGAGEAPKRARTKKPAKSASTAPTDTQELNDDAAALAEKLKEWCKAEAKRLGLPPYFVLNDQTLKRIAAARPRTKNQLLAIEGIADAKVEKFGAAILELCAKQN